MHRVARTMPSSMDDGPIRAIGRRTTPGPDLGWGRLDSDGGTQSGCGGAVPLLARVHCVAYWTRV
eukprot:scaffold89263_cov88-Phaeocystis_antarctica.AAC.1